MPLKPVKSKSNEDPAATTINIKQDDQSAPKLQKSQRKVLSLKTAAPVDTEILEDDDALSIIYANNPDSY